MVVLLMMLLVCLSITTASAQAGNPNDYFLPPGGRIIEMPPPTWREMERREVEPTGFRDVPWGASEAELQSKMSVKSCWDVGGGGPERVCKIKLMVGDIPATTYIGFRADKMVSYTYIFARDDFFTMLLALKERYGVPTEELSGKQLGQESSNHAFVWVGERTTVSLHRLIDKTEQQSMVVFETKEESNENLGRFKRLKGKAAKDLD